MQWFPETVPATYQPQSGTKAQPLLDLCSAPRSSSTDEPHVQTRTQLTSSKQFPEGPLCPKEDPAFEKS